LSAVSVVVALKAKQGPFDRPDNRIVIRPQGRIIADIETRSIVRVGHYQRGFNVSIASVKVVPSSAWKRAAITVLACILGGVMAGVVIEVLAKTVAPGTPANDRSAVEEGLLLAVLIILQFWYLVMLLRSLSFERSKKNSEALQSTMKCSFGVVSALLALLAIATPIEIKVGDAGAVEFTCWIAVTVAFVLFVAKIAAEEWDGRMDLQKEIAGFLIGIASSALIVFIALGLILAESYFHWPVTFTTEVANTALIAATVMSVPVGLWLIFLLRQPGPSATTDS
jgi:small-conductance mechanosensitive channel